MTPAVSVVIPARDAARTLPRTLEAVGALDAPELEVIVVDDGSTDDTPAIARAAGATVVAGPGQGPATARNLGAAAAAAPVLAFTDSDCYPTPGWLRAALGALEDGADLVQGAVTPCGDTGAFDRTLWVVAEAGLYESANIVVRRELFERLGGFQSWLRPRHGIELGEDALLGWEARRAGARVRFVPEALVHHEVFERDARAYVLERRRLSAFPALVQRIPELRDTMAYRRVFLSQRTARFDLAAAAVLVALATRRATPLLAAAPYALLARKPIERWGPRYGARVFVAQAAADAVGLVALAAGSIRARTPLL